MKRNAALIFCIFFIFTATFVSFATAGSSSDPLISLSYITSKLIPDVTQLAKNKADTAFSQIYENSSQKLTSEKSALLLKASFSSISSSFLNAVQNKVSGSDSHSAAFTSQVFKNGETIAGSLGTSFFLRSGSAAVYGGILVNITEGREIAQGTALIPNNRYMSVTDGDSGVRITSASAEIDISGTYNTLPAYTPLYTDLADALKTMSLFKGGDSGYALDRAANRLEALVMLIRLIGEENAALAFNGSHPFNDVPEWGRPYVAYAYNKGYTNGVSSTRFGTEPAVLPSQYMTYILRALGYSDSAGDFTWDRSVEKALDLGYITRGENIALQNGPFYRDHVVYISYFTLDNSLKGSTQTLLNKLINAGVLSQNTADTAKASVKTVRIK